MLTTTSTLRSLVSGARFVALSIAVVLVTLGGVAPAVAGVMDDFKAASSREGCDSIPYSDKRRECNAIQNEINECKKPGVNCKSLLTTKEKLIEKINNAEKQVVFMKDKRSKLEAERDRHKDPGQIKSFEGKIKQATDEIEDAQKTISADTQKLKDFDKDNGVLGEVDRGERCLNFRAGMRELFEDVSDALRSEPRKSLSSGATEKEKAELTAYAKTIIDHIKREEGGHKIAEAEYKGRMDNCQKVINTKK